MITILWCTIRPTQFKNFHQKWMEKADNKENIRTIVAVNWEEHKEFLKDYPVEVLVVNTDKIILKIAAVFRMSFVARLFEV